MNIAHYFYRNKYVQIQVSSCIKCQIIACKVHFPGVVLLLKLYDFCSIDLNLSNH